MTANRLQMLRTYAADRDCIVTERMACAVTAGADPYYVEYPRPTGDRAGRDVGSLSAALAIIVHAHRAMQAVQLADMDHAGALDERPR